MSLTLVKIQNHLRVCASCGRGSFLKPSSIDLYCQPCWETLLQFSQATYCDDYPFKVCSLFTWTAFSPEVENLIYSLKGGGLPFAFQRLAEQFAFSRSAQNHMNPQNATLLIPPGRVAKDHAYQWGSAVSRQLSLKICSPFEFATSKDDLGFADLLSHKIHFKQQKRLRKKERFNRQFELNHSLPLDAGRLIFVDDLVTTGATAMAAYKALNSPKDFEVWAIARRPKL